MTLIRRIFQLATYFAHKYKCMPCGLHFTVFSDYKEWPDRGTTRDLQHGEATGLTYCPECGSTGVKIHWREEVDGFIFQAVPGSPDVELVGYGV